MDPATTYQSHLQRTTSTLTDLSSDSDQEDVVLSVERQIRNSNDIDDFLYSRHSSNYSLFDNNNNNNMELNMNNDGPNVSMTNEPEVIYPYTPNMSFILPKFYTDRMAPIKEEGPLIPSTSNDDSLLQNPHVSGKVNLLEIGVETINSFSHDEQQSLKLDSLSTAIDSMPIASSLFQSSSSTTAQDDLRLSVDHCN
jgi:hypothetical protein